MRTFNPTIGLDQTLCEHKAIPPRRGLWGAGGAPVLGYLLEGTCQYGVDKAVQVVMQVLCQHTGMERNGMGFEQAVSHLTGCEFSGVHEQNMQ